MARSLYREWFVNFRFPGNETVPRVESPLGPIPEGWEVSNIPECVEINPRLTVPRDVEKPFVPMSSLSNDSMVISDIEAKSGNSGSKFQNDDTLFARITPCLENGKTGYVQFLPSADAIACGSTEFIVLRSRALTPEFVYCLARSEEFRNNAIKSMSGASGRQRVQEKCFGSFLIPKPPLILLKRFSSIAAPCFRLINQLHVQTENLRETRDLLLPRLLSGTINVSESSSFNHDNGTTIEATTATQKSSIARTNSNQELPRSSDALSSALADTRASSWDSIQTHSGKQPDFDYEQLPPIDQTDRSDVLAIIRQVFSDGQSRTRENAIRDVAQALGYGRVGHRIQDVLHTDLLTAVRRGILENVGGELRLLVRSIADYERDFLKLQFLASIGRSWIKRDDAVQNFCRWMGFRRTGPVIDETARSVINGLLRESRLEADGPNLIRRTS
jgi:hypothetical protein